MELMSGLDLGLVDYKSTIFTRSRVILILNVINFTYHDTSIVPRE